jgi:hypothetical protein
MFSRLARRQTYSLVRRIQHLVRAARIEIILRLHTHRWAHAPELLQQLHKRKTR